MDTRIGAQYSSNSLTHATLPSTWFRVGLHNSNEVHLQITFSHGGPIWPNIQAVDISLAGNI